MRQGEPEVTLMLRAAASGEPGAAEKLLPLVYAELRAMAASNLRRAAPGHTLQPTALVHEAYIKLVGAEDPGWSGRVHFLASAARAMREIMVDHARRKGALKRGGGWRRAGDPEHVAAAEPWRPEDVLALEDALEQLEQADPRRARIVELRYYAGLDHQQTAHVLGVSERTVERDWRFARAWLREQLTGTPPTNTAGDAP